MVTKEKMISWNNYLARLKDRLDSVKKGEVPAKHVNHPDSYARFLNNEIKLVTTQIEDGKLEIGGK